MRNILKMDFYRMIKSKSLWVFTLIMVVTSFIAILAISKLIEHGGSGAGINIVLEANRFPLIKIFGMIIATGLTSVFTSIFVAKFINNENKNGFIKSIAGILPNKGLFVISKMIISITFVLWCFVMWFGFLALFSKIIFGYIDFTGFAENFYIISGLLLANIAFAIFISFLTIWFRNAGFSMMVGILMYSGISYLIGNAINLLFNKVLNFDNVNVKVGFLSTYFVTDQVTKNTIIVSSIYLVVSAILGFIIMQKRDIK